MLEKFFLSKFFSKAPTFLSHIYVLLVIMVSFVLFNADGMGEAVTDIGAMFGAGGLPLYNSETLYYLRSYAAVIIIGIIAATPLGKNAVMKLRENDKLCYLLNFAEPAAELCLLIVVTAYLVDGSFNPFLYFRF